MSAKVPYLIVVLAILAAVGLRRRRRGAGRAQPSARGWGPSLRSDVALVAAREVRERTRGRVFRVGTVIILLAVAAAIVIPSLRHNSPTSQRIGTVGTVSTPVRQSLLALGPAFGTTIHLTPEPDLAAAEGDLDAGRLDIVLVDTARLVVKTSPVSGDTSSTTAQLVQAVSSAVGLQAALQAAGLSAQQRAAVIHPAPLPVAALHPAGAPHDRGGRTTTLYGLILLFVLLAQYGTTILLGVVEEKSSRVVEVLLATVRPRHLLAGKVIGIGIVALIQAALILVVALGLGAVVGSDLLQGANPTNVLATLVWLILGYAFYCWIYAAAGSLATRQEHVQTLALPLQLPILLGYITSLTAISSGHASAFVEVLAYLPPTAPFAMPVLLALGQATWWQFTLAVALTLLATVVVARLAATIYLRAILQTGRRVRLRDVAGRHPAGRTAP